MSPFQPIDAQELNGSAEVTDRDVRSSGDLGEAPETVSRLTLDRRLRVAKSQIVSVPSSEAETQSPPSPA
jgi:hypothetical protein